MKTQVKASILRPYPQFGRFRYYVTIETPDGEIEHIMAYDTQVLAFLHKWINDRGLSPLEVSSFGPEDTGGTYKLVF